ncbi:GNAT family N-acetyltransferase [Gordonia soli]|uniref:Putative acetyltransferase n=1 Tax=Gordonia soli NBRC 108243 TaxID=1223545 RepID=M0QEE1_9ACTN|nr:GNAT family protein [Gordonia soli]GAC66940.1 putative acetyltransferase [Gordonia soli NBRC 108243]
MTSSLSVPIPGVSWRQLPPVARSYLSRAKRRVVGALDDVLGSSPDTVLATPETRTPSGRVVRLRRPMIADADAWRRERLYSRDVLEPYWPSSRWPWRDRHSTRAWIDECVDWRRRTRNGAAFPSVIEVDGEFAGQCNLEWIDGDNGTTEVGIWISRRYVGDRIAFAAISLVIDFAFDTLDLQRITAPIHVDNAAAQHLADRTGFVREGTMRNYTDAGGERADHVLYALTRPDRRSHDLP